MTTCGKTRLLEAQKHRPAPEIEQPAERGGNLLSYGQTIALLAETLLDVQPTGSCLLIDDVVECLDDKNRQRLIARLTGHDKQSIMTIKDREEIFLNNLAAIPRCRVFRIRG